jgi:uncharacterized protein (DUF486 family)
MFKTILLLIGSNTFMTVAWYGHLKFTDKPLWLAILISWLIAFFEYCLQVPANRIGYEAHITPYQLKIIQEVLTLSIFIVFAFLYFGVKPHWNHWVAFACILGAVYFGVMPNAAADN